MRTYGKAILAVIAAVFAAGLCFLCALISPAVPQLHLTLAATESPLQVYGATAVVRVVTRAENQVDVDWEIAWADESETLPIGSFYKLRPLSKENTMTVDLICYGKTEREAELSAWIHGAPHTRITKKVTSPFTAEEKETVTDGIDEIVMPATAGSLHPLFPEDETARAIVTLTQDTLLSVNADGSPADGFLKLTAISDDTYIFEIADPDAKTPAGEQLTMDDVVATLYMVLDRSYDGCFGALASFISGVYDYQFSGASAIGGITVLDGKLMIDASAGEREAFLAAMRIPVLKSYSFCSWNGHAFGPRSSAKHMASDLKRTSVLSNGDFVSGSYSVRTSGKDYVFTRNDNSRRVRAGGQFPQTVTIKTEEADALTYLGDKLFVEETENTRSYANGNTFYFAFSNGTASAIRDKNNDLIKGDPAAFRRTLGHCLETASAEYAAAHGLFTVPQRYGTVTAGDLAGFTLSGGLTLRAGCVTGRDAGLVKEIVTDAVESLNGLLRAHGVEQEVTLEVKEYSDLAVLEREKGGLDLWLNEYEDHIASLLERANYRTRYSGLGILQEKFGREFHHAMVVDPFYQEDLDWYDSDLSVFRMTDQELYTLTYTYVYEEELYEMALDVPVFRGESVYRLPSEPQSGRGYGAYLTPYRTFFDHIAQGWTYSESRMSYRRSGSYGDHGAWAEDPFD